MGKFSAALEIAVGNAERISKAMRTISALRGPLSAPGGGGGGGGGGARFSGGSGIAIPPTVINTVVINGGNPSSKDSLGMLMRSGIMQ